MASRAIPRVKCEGSGRVPRDLSRFGVEVEGSGECPVCLIVRSLEDGLLPWHDRLTTVCVESAFVAAR